jgi:hypothetical protein
MLKLREFNRRSTVVGGVVCSSKQRRSAPSLCATVLMKKLIGVIVQNQEATGYPGVGESIRRRHKCNLKLRVVVEKKMIGRIVNSLTEHDWAGGVTVRCWRKCVQERCDVRAMRVVSTEMKLDRRRMLNTQIQEATEYPGVGCRSSRRHKCNLKLCVVISTW